MKKTFLTLITFAMATLAFAQGPGHQRTHIAHHPRVDQVNRRIDRQEGRIDDKRKDGDMTKQQAHEDRSNLKTINKEKRGMRKEDDGHLTKGDQKVLNKQLDKNSKDIKNQ